MTTRERVQQHLAQLTSLDGARRLLAELNYEVTRQPLSRHGWPEAARKALAEDPQIVAEQNGFHVIYGRLPEKDTLSLTGERHVINALLREHPYALFLFSDEDASHWHFVNVKYDGDGAEKRRVFRRITVGPYERQQGRLRTASDRLALLDLATISRDLSGLSPLAVQQRHDEAFNVEAVTRDFFRDYRQIFEAAEAQIAGLPDAEELRLFTQRLFNRLMFIMFLERKGWLAFNGRQDYLLALWQAHQQEWRDDPDASFFRDRLTLLFFAGLNTKNEVDLVNIGGDFLQSRIGHVPYLNGGLFEEDELDRAPVQVPDAIFGRALNDLFYGYNFTVTESTPLDVEVAVDPEMLGRIFEELVTGRHESGSYYTPKPIVSFMGREALKGYLETACSEEGKEAISAFVDERDATRLRDPEGVLEALRTVTICDPACGSGAYLVGMLQELLLLRQALFASRRLDAVTMYERKLEIIQNNLYGVDIDPFAVNIARLRLWLSLVVEYEGPKPEPLPNLDFKIEVGDSLTGPDPSGGLQPDLFRHQQIRDYFLLKADFMEAHGGDKRELIPQIEALRKEIQAWAHPQKLDLVEGSNGFDWVVEFAEVFGAHGQTGGFDIVIANPPYVEQRRLGETLKKQFRSLYPEVHSGYNDLYVYFFARGLQLLRHRGILTFISSNRFMRAGYGKKLRLLLATESTLRVVIDFGDLPIFKAAAYPVVVVVEKRRPEQDSAFHALAVDDITLVPHILDVVNSDSWLQDQDALGARGWTLMQPAVTRLLQKLRGSHLEIGQQPGIQMYRGVTTGRNESFVINGETRERLIEMDPRSAEIIKPWIRGRNTARWQINRADEYLIFTYRGIDIGEYPAVENYLSQDRVYLEPGTRMGRKRGDYAWYEIQDATRYAAEFEKPKIVWAKYGITPAFTYDRTGFFCANTVFIMPTTTLALLGVLNSSVIQWYAMNTFNIVRGGYIEWIPANVSRLPIPSLETRLQQTIEKIVESLLNDSLRQEEVRAFEHDINLAVYELYELNDQAINLIEEALEIERSNRAFKTASNALDQLRDLSGKGELSSER